MLHYVLYYNKFNIFITKMIVDSLDSFYSSLRKLNKLESLLRFSTRKLSNVILPFYLKITKKNVILPATEGDKIIISITTFPQRISKIWIVIECILRQSLLPNKIVLWLSKEQFPNEIHDLPENLLKYYKSQVDIVFVDDDLRSHKKYYYALKEYSSDIIITLDDDIYYPSNIIKDLTTLHKLFPTAICCHRAHKVVRDVNGEIKEYSKWPKVYENYGPAFDLFHTSGGGTLYKKSFFNENVLDKEVFKVECFMADDVWLNIMAQLNKTKTVKSKYFSNLIPIENKSSIFKLSRENVEYGGNDIQFKKVIQKYKLNSHEIFR